MYKTLRHGENSLQYTILPQNDDYRSGTGGGEGSRKRNSTTCRHNRKRSIVAYVGLFFVGAVIAGTLLIPLMVTSDLMPSPASWFYRAQKAREMRNPVTVKYHVEKTALPPGNSSQKIKKQKTQSPAWSDMLNITEFEKLYDESNALAAKSTTSTPPVVRFTPHLQPLQSTTETTSTTTGKTSTAATPPKPQIIPSNTPIPTMINTQKQPLLSRIRDFTRFSSKPIVMVSQQKDKIPVNSASDKTLEENNWVQSHWPYVDPSTYFQWVGYNTEDRVILPAVLGITLILILIIVVLCVIARRKGVCQACARRNGKNVFEKLESQNDDNKTLLTNENHSEEE